MAGYKTYLTLDPALVKYANLGPNRHKFFRWTPRTAGITIMYAVVVPSLIGYLAYTTDGKYEMRGKLRGDTIVEY